MFNENKIGPKIQIVFPFRITLFHLTLEKVWDSVNQDCYLVENCQAL